MIGVDFSLSIFGSERGFIILRLHYCYFINLEDLSFSQEFITTQSERQNKGIKKKSTKNKKVICTLSLKVKAWRV